MHLQGAGVWNHKTAWLCSPLRLPLHIPSSHRMSLWQVWQRQHWLHCARLGTQLLLLRWNERIKNNGHFSSPTLVLKDHGIQNVCVCSVLGCKPLAKEPSIPLSRETTVLTGKRSSGLGVLGPGLYHHSFLYPYCWLPKFYSLSTHSFVRAFLLNNLRNHLGYPFLLDRGMHEFRGREGKWKSVKGLHLAQSSARL